MPTYYWLVIHLVTHQHHLLLVIGLQVGPPMLCYMYVLPLIMNGMDAVPYSGRLVSEINRARREIIQIIQRRQHHEMMLKDLFTKKLKSSDRGIQFHLRDMIGGNKLKVTPTSQGKLVQIVKLTSVK
jgi:hypothetical protein